MRYRVLILLFATAIFLPALPVEAVDFAEPLVGHTTVEKTDHTIIHDGMGGNEVVFNPNPETTIGFNKNNLETCATAMSDMDILSIDDIIRCFYMDNAAYNSMLLTSRTKRDGYSEVETAAFIYDKLIRGDVYGLNSGAINFKLQGRNLKQRTADVDNETWASNDILNDKAQAYFTASSEQAKSIRKKIANMAAEAKVVNANTLVAAPIWYLQKSDLTTGGVDESSLYPEGKTWLISGCGVVGSTDVCAKLSLPQYQYVGKGTLIFLPPGNNERAEFELNSSVSIKPFNNSTNHSLGIIVAGRDANGDVADNSANAKVIFNGKNSIEAAMLVLGSINAGSGGLTGIGSFVAQEFNFGTASKYSLLFQYDPRLENNWPPGFRYFNMPRADAAAP